MSHFDEHADQPAPRGAPGLDRTGPHDAGLSHTLSHTLSAADPERELATLRRNLLLYGTAGQATRVYAEAHAA